ncbi:MAG: hypothetical protein ACHRHE_13885 [Tepidisphaerales bacterium]
MGYTFWQWLLHSDGGLMLRVGIGVAILSTLAIVDVRRHGPAARRWREYLFLLAAAGVAMVYGVANDQITVSISWEYFYYGKGIEQVLGAAVPPPMAGLRWEAAKIGLKAAWSVGLAAGVVLLLANNPSRRWRQLPMKTLYRLLAVILIGPVLGAIAGGVLGRMGVVAHLSADLADLVRLNLWRPRSFLCVSGIHLGAYAGGIVATLLAAAWIVKRRSRLVANRGNLQTHSP